MKINIVNCRVEQIFLLHQSIKGKTGLWYKSLFLKDNDLFISTYQGFVFQLNVIDGKLSRVFNIHSLIQQKLFIDKIFIDDKKQPWLFTQKGVIIIDTGFNKIKKDITVFSLTKNPNDTIISFSEISVYNNELVAATNYGIFSFNTQEQEVSNQFVLLNKIPPLLATTQVLAFNLSAQNFYISNPNGLFRVDPLSGEFFKILNSGNYNDLDWFTNVYAIFTEGSRLWLGNQQGISLIKNINSPFTPYKSSFDGTGSVLNHCYHLFPKNDSVIFSCTSDGLYSVNTNKSTIDKIDGSQPYYQVFKGIKDDILASGEKKMYVINGLIKTDAGVIYPELNQISSDFIIASISFKDSLIFLASQNNRGLYIWNLITRRLTTINESSRPLFLKDLRINNFLIDPKNRLWIISNSIISVYDINNHTLQHHYINHPQTNEHLNILMDACTNGDKCFVAVYGKGIVEIDQDFKSQKFVDTRNGLSNIGLYKIFFCNDTSLISSSNDGLFHYDFKNNLIKKITADDGLHSNSFDETSGVKYKEYIFLGGLNGFTKIQPKKIAHNKEAPRCYFSTIEIQTPTYSSDTLNLYIKKISISNNYTQVKINFSCINFSNSKKTTYFYRINKLHKDWINIKNEEHLALIGLSPGTYHLQVQAFNEDDVPSEIRELILVFLPKWYQTWWFKIILVLAVAFFFYGLYKFRMNHIKREEKIRNQLAGDLHDELGSTLNSVKIFASLAMMEKENTRIHLEKIKESTQAAIAGVRDIIWVLDDKRDTVDDLMTRIRQFAKPLCEASHISYRQEADESLGNNKLGKEEKRNLYMIIKESVNNSIKYANCENIQLVVSNPGGKLNIKISDDGTGFDKDKTVKGNGLKNIMYRSKEIGYRASINTSPGKGTTIALQKT